MKSSYKHDWERQIQHGVPLVVVITAALAHDSVMSQSVWRIEVGTIGQQALKHAKDAAES